MEMRKTIYIFMCCKYHTNLKSSYDSDAPMTLAIYSCPLLNLAGACGTPGLFGFFFLSGSPNLEHPPRGVVKNTCGAPYTYDLVLDATTHLEHLCI
jgi:hypothetical protein